MGKIDDLLSEIAHRPWETPAGQWHYYQEWNRVLFFHWKIEPEKLLPLLPKNLELDTFDGEAWVSLVPFTMQKIRPRFLPSFAPVSDFHEINLRTYVTRNGKPGVYFINIEAQKSLSAFLSRRLSGLPYEKSMIMRGVDTYKAENRLKKFFLDIEFAVKEFAASKTPLEKWLTERYALYLEQNGRLFRYDTHHREWKIKMVDVKKLNLDYKIGAIDLTARKPDLAHYSDGVEVVAWKRVAV